MTDKIRNNIADSLESFVSNLTVLGDAVSSEKVTLEISTLNNEAADNYKAGFTVEYLGNEVVCSVPLLIIKNSFVWI